MLVKSVLRRKNYEQFLKLKIKFSFVLFEKFNKIYNVAKRLEQTIYYNIRRENLDKREKIGKEVTCFKFLIV